MKKYNTGFFGFGLLMLLGLRYSADFEENSKDFLNYKGNPAKCLYSGFSPQDVRIKLNFHKSRNIIPR